MKIIEELESLENGENPALFTGNTGLKTPCQTLLFELTATIAALNALQIKYPHHRLLIANKGEYDWSEFALFGEREETAAEKQKRLEKKAKIKEAEKVKIQKQIESLKRQQAKLEQKIK
jgi:hypothetical protein